MRIFSKNDADSCKRIRNSVVNGYDISPRDTHFLLGCIKRLTTKISSDKITIEDLNKKISAMQCADKLRKSGFGISDQMFINDLFKGLNKK